MRSFTALVNARVSLSKLGNGMVVKLLGCHCMISMHMKGTDNLCGLSGCHLSSVSQYNTM